LKSFRDEVKMKEELKIRFLSDLIDFKNGKSIKPSSGNIPIYGGNGILGYSEKYNYNNILIIGRVGAYCGSIHYHKEKCWVSDNAIAGEVKSDYSIDYLYYLMKSLNLNDRQVGSSQPLLTQGVLNNISVKIYESSQTQQSITAILSALDKKIALNKQINARLEEMAKTLYDYWFVQFDFPDASGKPYKSSGGEMVFDETLKRKIPKGWKSVELQSCLAKIPNTAKILNKDIKYFGKYPVIDQSQDFICGFTDDEKSILNPQDAHIIFGDHTRIVKLVNFKYARGADGTQVILSNNERMPNYLFYQVINQIDLSSYGYARHFKFLKEFLIILPDKDISQKYNEIANTFFIKIRNNIKQNHQLTQLRDFLLPMLMNGQVSVAE
jgi:type I restriction enzyme, S subunit